MPNTCRRPLSHLLRAIAVAGLVVGGFALTLPKVRAQEIYDPYHPEVQAMVEHGLAYIGRSKNTAVGPASLLAIAICEAEMRYHERIPVENEVVKEAVRGAAQFTLDSNGECTNNNTLYEPCIAMILLAIVDPVEYEPNIRAVLRLLEMRQQPTGCWKYLLEGAPPTRGDTSQTQYCCLAIWMASKVGIRANNDMVERALDWLMFSQTGAGGWEYRAESSRPKRGAGGETLSITAAGAGGVYMLLDAVNAKNVFGPRGAKRVGADFPVFVSEYTPEEAAADQNGQPTADANINAGDVQQCVNAAKQYFEQNFTTNPNDWTYYYLYGFERYAYFREQVDGQVIEVPNWYDQGVEFLKATQGGDGSWRPEGTREKAVLSTVTTAFAILFLVRSTDLLAKDPGKGPLFGGEAIPRSQIRQVGNKMYGQEVTRDINDFLTLVRNQDDESIKEFASSLTKIVFPTDPAQRELYMSQLRVLITDPDAYKRLIAVKALGGSRDLNNVPALLMAMQDPEPEIKKMAHRGLRFISRKLDSIKLPEDPSEGDFLTALNQWAEWYNEVKPDAP